MSTLAEAEQAGTKGTQRWPGRLVALLVVLVGGWAYWPTLRDVVDTWSADPDYSHGYLVVPLALLFLWLRRDRRPQLHIGFQPAGLALLIAAAALRFAAGRYYLPELNAWSVPIWLAGTVWTLGGWSLLRWTLPSLAFLWFAMPLPGTIALALSVPLQQLAAQLSGVALQMAGQPAVVEGTTILLREESLEVERACSGLRMFYGIAALAFASVIIMRPRWQQALAIVLAIAPVAVLMNVLRIVATGLLTHYFPQPGLEQQVHDMSGVAVLPAAMLLFLGLIALMDRVATQWRNDARRLAPWLLGGFVGCLAVAVLGTWRYAAQSKAAEATLLQTATRYVDEGEVGRGIEYLNRYTQVRPDDKSAKIRLAELFAETAATPADKLRAIELLQTAYQAEPQRRDLAYQAVDLGMETGSFDTALSILEQLRTSTADRPDARWIDKQADVLLAFLRSPQGRRQTRYSWQDVATALRTSIQRETYPATHAVALAVVTREHLTEPSEAERVAEADRLVARMVAARPNDPEARFARYEYTRTYHGESVDFDPAADLDVALDRRDEASPQIRANILLAAAKMADRAASQRYLAEAIEADPTLVPAYLELARISRSEEERASAIDVMQRGLEQNSDEPLPVVFRLAELLAEAGRDGEVQQLLTPIRAALPRIADPGTRRYAEVGVSVVEAIQAERRNDAAEVASVLRPVLDANQRPARLSHEYAAQLADAWGRLAHAYEALGRRYDALEAWKQAAALAPDSVLAEERLSRAALAADDVAMALDISRQRARRDETSAEAWIALARAQLAEQMQRPPAQRDFAQAEQSLQRAANLDPPREAFLLVAIDLRRAEGRGGEAIKVLERELERRPAQPRLWQMLAMLQVEQDDFAAATDAVDQLAAIGGTQSATAALRARILAAQGRVPQAIDTLQRARTEARQRDQLDLLLLTASLYRQAGDVDRARAALLEAHRAHPDQLAPLEGLAQQAFAQQQWNELAEWERKLREVEGDSGSLWRAYRAMRLLFAGPQPTGEQLESVAALASAIATRRPRWAMGPYLQAHVALRRGDQDQAAANLERAWQLGMRDAASAEQLMALLSAAGRTEDLKQFAAQLGELPMTAPGVFDRVLPVLLQSGQGTAAVDQARRWAEANPDEPQALTRLGWVLVLSSTSNEAATGEQPREWSEAEQVFQQATRLAPDSVQAWSSLYTFYLRINRRDAAADVLRRLESEGTFEPVQKAALAARLNSAAGDLPATVTHWLAAAEAAQDADSRQQAAVLGDAAEYFAERCPRLAEQYCRQALVADPDAKATRLLLVRLLGARGGSEATSEAVELLLQDADAPETMSAVETRMYARLLGERGRGDDVAEAIDAMERLSGRTRDDERLLADLYELAGRTAAAYERLNQLASASPVPVADLTRFLAFWQTHFEQEDQFTHRANEVLAQLGRTREGLPEQLRWQLRLKAREASADELVGLLDAFWQGSAAQQALARPEEATPLLAEVMQVAIDEARERLLQHLVESPPKPVSPDFAARLLANVLMATDSPRPAVVDTVERILDTQIDAHPDSLALIRDAADLAAVAGRNARAMALYVQTLAADPSNLSAANNRACLWSLEADQRTPALEWVADALAAEPENATLLDTRGQILLAGNQPKEAVASLDKAIEIDPTGAVAYLHRARAHTMLGELDRAKADVVTALVLGIEARPLLASDREMLRDLRETCNL